MIQFLEFYADSAQVNAVIGRLVELSLSFWYYIYALFLLSFLSPTMGVIALSLSIPTIFWARWAMPRMRIRSLVYRATTSDLTSRIQESFAALKLIKAYDAGDRIQEGMEKDSVIAMNAAFQSRRLVALLMIIMFVIASIFLLSGEFFMGYSANQGNKTYANELIALMAVSWVVWNLGAFQWARNTISYYLKQCKAIYASLVNSTRHGNGFKQGIRYFRYRARYRRRARCETFNKTRKRN